MPADDATATAADLGRHIGLSRAHLRRGRAVFDDVPGGPRAAAGLDSSDRAGDPPDVARGPQGPAR